jgi:hypothetical protein
VLQHEEAQELNINFDLNYVVVIDSIPVIAEKLMLTMESSLPGSSVVPEVILPQSIGSHLH